MPNSYQIETLKLALMDAVAPDPCRCYLCDEEAKVGEDGLCDDCRRTLLYCPDPVYRQPLDGLTVGLTYTDAVKDAVLRFKNGRKPEYAAFFAQYMRIPREWEADILVPVPMHPLKEYTKKFHHTACLCAFLSGLYKIPYSRELLQNVRYTKPQKGLGAKARQKNLHNSFFADPHCEGLRIVLIDDVTTTGATLCECAKMCKLAGAKAVYGCCAATPKL